MKASEGTRSLLMEMEVLVLNAARVCFICAVFGSVPPNVLAYWTDFVNLPLGDSPLRYLMESLDQNTLGNSEIKLDAQMETLVCHS